MYDYFIISTGVIIFGGERDNRSNILKKNQKQYCYQLPVYRHAVPRGYRHNSFSF